jgi:putative endonuclease
MFYVYIIHSEKFNKFYTGFTENVQRRLKEHNKGKTKSTKAFIPWKLVFTQECRTRTEARIKEKYYKSGSGREKIKKLIKTY